jgi:acyl carrier protein
MNEDTLRELLSRVAERDLSGIGNEEDLKNALDLDSLTALRMLAAVEKHCEVRFPDDRLDQYRTLKDILEFMQQERAS